MKNNLLAKTLVLGIIVLFIGAGVYPAFAVEIKSTMIDNKNDENCDCDVKIEYKQVIADRLITRLKSYINRIFFQASVASEFEDEFNELLDAFNSDRPICNLVLQINESISQKKQDVYELINQYKLNPIRGRIYLSYMLILLTINIYLIPLWFLSDCGDWP